MPIMEHVIPLLEREISYRGELVHHIIIDGHVFIKALIRKSSEQDKQVAISEVLFVHIQSVCDFLLFVKTFSIQFPSRKGLQSKVFFYLISYYRETRARTSANDWSISNSPSRKTVLSSPFSSSSGVTQSVKVYCPP